MTPREGREKRMITLEEAGKIAAKRLKGISGGIKPVPDAIGEE